MSLRSISVLLPLCAALVACGGESSRSDDPPTLTGGPVAGRAAKGVIQDADVDAYQRVGGGWTLATTTSTDMSGAFTFEDGLPAGPVLLVVHGNAGGTSRVVCDAADGCGDAGLEGGEEITVNGIVDFGETLPLPEGFEMRAILPAERTGLVAAITPATDMAATFVSGLPGEINDRSIGIALNQVAGLLGLSADFYRVTPLDITNAAELALASDSAIQQALIAAAMATQDSGDMGESMAAYSQRFFRYAGQLPLEGEYSVLSLDAAAQQVLGALGSPAGASDYFQEWLDGFAGAQSAIALSGDYDTDDLAQASLSLDPLNTYLNMAGIDATGTFLQNEAAQVEWLVTEETLNMLTLMVQSVGLVLQTAIVASEPAALPASFDLAVDGGMAVPAGLTATYTKADNQLVISGTTTADSQTISVTFVITPLLQGLQAGELDYSVLSTASIINPELVGTLAGSMNIDLYETEVLGLLSASTEEEQAAALDALLSSLNIRVTIDGAASLAKFDDTEYRYEGEIVAFAEVDIPGLQNADPFVELNIASGSLTSPEGDSIYSLDGNALNIVIDATSTLDANFGFEAFGMPAMEVNAEGALLGIGDLVLEFALALQASDTLDLGAILGIIEMLDFSVLQIEGEGGLNIPSAGTAWTFLLDGNRFDASTPNGGELGNGGTLALSYYLTSFNGGFIYSGDSLVGAVTYDWDKLGATIRLIDGSERAYFLGSLAELLGL